MRDLWLTMTFVFDIKLTKPLTRGQWNTIGVNWQPISPPGAFAPTEVTFSSQCFCCCFLGFFVCLSPTFHITHPIAPPLAPTHRVQKFKRQDQNNLHQTGNYRRWQMSHIVTARFFRGIEYINVGLVSDCLQQGTESRFSDMKQPVMFWKALQPLCVIVWPWSTCPHCTKISKNRTPCFVHMWQRLLRQIVNNFPLLNCSMFSSFMYACCGDE